MRSITTISIISLFAMATIAGAADNSKAAPVTAGKSTSAQIKQGQGCAQMPALMAEATKTAGAERQWTCYVDNAENFASAYGKSWAAKLSETKGDQVPVATRAGNMVIINGTLSEVQLAVERYSNAQQNRNDFARFAGDSEQVLGGHGEGVQLAQLAQEKLVTFFAGAIAEVSADIARSGGDNAAAEKFSAKAAELNARYEAVAKTADARIKYLPDPNPK